jgi:hypothetical protein
MFSSSSPKSFESYNASPKGDSGEEMGSTASGPQITVQKKKDKMAQRKRLIKTLEKETTPFRARVVKSESGKLSDTLAEGQSTLLR